MSRLERLDALYGEHRRTRRESGFVWGGAARSEPLRRAIGGPGKRILDLGCRTGALARAYAPGNEVVGLDVDREALAEAAALGIETVWADAEEPLPFADASFDVVVAAELLEHVREPEQLVAEIGRVLRPAGTIAGSVPNSYRLKNRLRFLSGARLRRTPRTCISSGPAISCACSSPSRRPGSSTSSAASSASTRGCSQT
jgi:SAM-dependent methyltransferase